MQFRNTHKYPKAMVNAINITWGIAILTIWILAVYIFFQGYIIVPLMIILFGAILLVLYFITRLSQAEIAINESGISAFVLGFLWKESEWSSLVKVKKITDWDAGAMKPIIRVQLYTSECENIFSRSGPFTIDERISGFDQIVEYINKKRESLNFEIVTIKVVTDSNGSRGLRPKYIETRVRTL